MQGIWPPLEIIQSEVYSKVPDHLAKTAGGKSAGRLEGPSTDREGNLYCTDMSAGRIYRITPDKTWEVVVEYDGHPNSLKLHKDGRGFITDRYHGIMVLDMKTGKIETLLSGPSAGQKFKAVNDLHFASNGDLYFTDQGRTGLQDPTGCVYRLTAAGGLDTIISNAPSPNGLVLSKRENALYVAVTRASAVWRIELEDPELRAGLFQQLPCAGPDGVALDDAGNVVVAHPTLGGVWVYSNIGAPLQFVKTAGGTLTTNIAYGGPDFRTLFITETHTGTIMSARMPVRGRKMYGQS